MSRRLFWPTSAVVTAMLALGATGLARDVFSGLAVLGLAMIAVDEWKESR